MSKNKTSTLGNDINFLYEMGSLRFVERTWKQFLQSNVANDAEHTFRVMWIALVIARHEKIKNEEKIIKMALVHDIGESRCPDTNYLSKNYSTRDEKSAISDMVYNTSFSQDIKSLFAEYEDKKTIESKIVKDADLLDVDFEIQEQTVRGNVIKKHWDKNRAGIKFSTETARKLWGLLQKSDPQVWHIDAYNRKT